jgi:DNA-binding MarR family transcriptional regulator
MKRLQVDSAERLIDDLGRLARFYFSMEQRVLKKKKLSWKGLAALRMACTYDGVTFQNLQEALGLPKDRVSKLAGELATRALAEVVRQGRDQRTKMIRGTASGRSCVRDVDASLQEYLFQDMPGPYGRKARLERAKKNLSALMEELTQVRIFDGDSNLGP